ncbi:DNA mismatch repair protein MutL, partial [Spraguea lophii 42_110]
RDIYECRIIGQFNNEFIILSNKEKIFIIDQHAIHERIRYEKITRIYIEENNNMYNIFKIDKIIDERNKSIACSNAIKFGDKLNLFQIKNLILGFKECKYPFKCIHGRPTVISVIIKDKL